jgi:signal transduction histidine kinase
MEGSPVRGQEKAPVTKLNELQDIQAFQTELIRLVGAELLHADVFFGLKDVSSNTLQFPSWVKAHLDRHTELYSKLEQGEMVGISHSDEAPGLRPASAVRSSVVLIPLIGSAALLGAIGLVAPLDAPQLSAEDIEGVRQLVHEAAPILIRLKEIERLRRENSELPAMIARAVKAEEDLEIVVKEKNTVAAALQMRSLAAVRGYARMILDGRAGEVNETQREYLRVVTENTNRLISLVSWMSYVAELSAQHLDLSTFDMRDVWEESVRAVRRSLDEKLLKVAEQIADEPFLMIGDREKIAYVLTELLAAAAKFSEASGTITAELSHGREKEVMVKIAEKGASIPIDTLNRIFERSFNTIAQPTAQTTDAGAINLSGVYDIVGMHGGRIFVNTTAGESATFLFTLPAVQWGGEENIHEQAINSGRRRR